MNYIGTYVKPLVYVYTFLQLSRLCKCLTSEQHVYSPYLKKLIVLIEI